MENVELKNHLKHLERKLWVTYGIGLLVLIILSLCSNFILKEQAAKQATSLIKRMVERGDFRETIYTLNDAKLDYFDAVVYYGEEGNRQFSLPAQLDPEFASEHGFLSKVLYSRLPIDLYFGPTGEHKFGSVLFIFGRFSHVPYAFLIWLFFTLGTIPLVISARVRVTENYNKYVHLCEEATRADLARRVRHDIRSPLGALQIATQNISGSNPKQRAIIQRATERISEIVSELELIRISKNGDEPKSESTNVQSILTIAQDIIQEKRTQLAYKSQVHLAPEFSQDAFFLFANVNGSEFKRALSNIIDNAVEACEGAGRITVRVAKDLESVLIEVGDTGKGISKADLAHVKEKGFTRKATGSGLGLYYAEKTIQATGGSLSISSQENTGTTVSVRLPSSAPPSWYVPSIKIPINGTVVILDDQESTHLSWKMRLDELKAQGAEFSVASFTSAAELTKWHYQSAGDDALYLLDYDLGDGKKTGLDVARELALSANAILVTGHFDSEEIQKGCADQRIGLLPKSYLSLIQLQAI
jgi:signal transduction histidine kinase